MFWRKKSVEFKFFLMQLEEEQYASRYQSTGRYESLGDSLMMQTKLEEFISHYYPTLSVVPVNGMSVTPGDIKAWLSL
jgi:hypothetical protein